MDAHSGFLSIRQVADRLGLSETAVRRMIKKGKLPSMRTGPSDKVIRISERDLETYIASRLTPDREEDSHV